MMSNIEKKESHRGARGASKKFTEPDLITGIDSVLKIAEEKNLYQGGALDIESLISYLGINLEYIVMEGGVSGCLKNVDGEWIMSVNSRHHKNRQRFTLAHELGHYIMHKDKNNLFEDTTFFRGNDNDIIEYSANDFASNLLMPSKEVKRYIEVGIRELGILAMKFKVSPSAMKYRLEKLGYKFS